MRGYFSPVLKFIILATFVAAATAAVLPSHYPSTQASPLPSLSHEPDQLIDTVFTEPELEIDPEVPRSNYIPPDAPILDEHQVPVEPETNELELTAELEAHEVDVPLVPEAAVNPLTVDSVTPSSFYVPPPTSVSH